MPFNTPESTVDDAALKHLDSIEAEMLAEEKQQDAPPIDTTKTGDRAPVIQDDDKGASDSQNQTGIPSEAEKQEIESAKAEAEKEGKELDVDDKGTPKRGANGKFMRRDKVPVAKPIDAAVTGLVQEMQKLTKEQRDAVLDGLYPNASKLTKDNARRDRSWRALNEEKEAFVTEKTKHQQTLNAALARFNADVAKHREEIAASRPTPERFEAYAQKLTTDAALKEAEMVKAEANGDLDAAKELYAEVKGLRDKATEAKAHAEHLRKNPPPNEKQIQEKFKADQSTWVAKANTDFPEFAKKDSPVRNAAVETYKEITAADPQLGRLPGLIYHCVRYAAAKTAADRVPGMEKELGELRTKVKELELLTNPTPSGGVARQPAALKPFDQMSEDEQIEALNVEAAGMKR